jgi:hypothetical protein
VLVFDTETTTDAAQRLLFGSYRVYRRGELVQEGLIAGEGLDQAQRAVLEAYVRDLDADHGGELRLLSRAAFAEEVLWRIGYVARARIVGFNLPFDVSRVAVGVRASRRGGFSLRIFDSVRADGELTPHPWRPEVELVLRVEMLTGITVMGQAGKCRELLDQLRSHGILSQIESRRAVPTDTAHLVDIPAQIRGLATLRDEGLLTSAEFEAKKAELLNRM